MNEVINKVLAEIAADNGVTLAVLTGADDNEVRVVFKGADGTWRFRSIVEGDAEAYREHDGEHTFASSVSAMAYVKRDLIECYS